MNATAITAPATHDEWVALMLNSVSPFMRTVIREEYIIAAETGDYMDRLYLAGEVQMWLRLEAKTDGQLVTELSVLAEERQAYWDEEDFSEITWEDTEQWDHQMWAIRELQAYRAAQARYTNQPPLTHSPFAALAA
ncbi:hypothetical protein SEA_RABINOVISH_59 [Mycobacterium phage Rabinovish]|nr:hypothetical protein SEA_RABINOVISH_59 [Mycobacterium phage Rabinovish]